LAALAPQESEEAGGGMCAQDDTPQLRFMEMTVNVPCKEFEIMSFVEPKTRREANGLRFDEYNQLK